ncbi:hypothetical protein QE152_g7810 [Popillia japonica]|uniref:MD-2-related lipid-recognition domain-containing protein n=1 Tax=Popillia japonica TaxID=7064 RepID=A0AAW1ME45_POPJA
MHLLLYVFVLAFIPGRTPLKYTLVLNKFIGRCSGTNPKSSFDNIKISYMPSGDLSLDFDIVIHRPVRDSLKSTWIVERCASREALDTCSHFAEFNTTKFCNIISKAGSAWSSFMSCIQPKYSCPLKKITYFGRNCTVDPNRFFFPITGSYWKIKSEIVDGRDNALFMCLFFEGGVSVQH